jgi:GTP-binding protein
MRAMGRSDIAVLVLDGVEGITEQDTKIIGLLLKQGRACILLVNKWDLRAGEAGARDRYTQELRRRLPFIPWAPVLFGSALKPDSVAQVFPLLDRVAASFTARIPTGKLNKFLQELLAAHPLPVRKGRPGKATLSAYITQVSTGPPAFALFVGHPENVTANYLKLLENRLRDRFEFLGVPLHLMVRKK